MSNSVAVLSKVTHAAEDTTLLTELVLATAQIEICRVVRDNLAGQVMQEIAALSASITGPFTSLMCRVMPCS